MPMKYSVRQFVKRAARLSKKASVRIDDLYLAYVEWMLAARGSCTTSRQDFVTALVAEHRGISVDGQHLAGLALLERTESVRVL